MTDKSISVTGSPISHEEFARLVNDPNVGGASRTFRGKMPITGPGVMVSDSGKEEKSDPPLTPEQAEDYYNKNLPGADAVSAHGGWKDRRVIFQDTSRKYSDLDAARKAGETNNQISGYVLENTDVEQPHGGLMYFDRDVPGVQAEEDWKTGPNKTSKAERLSPRPKRGDRDELANVNRSSTRRNKRGQTVPVTINEVLDKIATNRRKRRKGEL